jgi:hypothetical protein
VKVMQLKVTRKDLVEEEIASEVEEVSKAEAEVEISQEVVLEVDQREVDLEEVVLSVAVETGLIEIMRGLIEAEEVDHSEEEETARSAEAEEEETEVAQEEATEVALEEATEVALEEATEEVTE